MHTVHRATNLLRSKMAIRIMCRMNKTCSVAFVALVLLTASVFGTDSRPAFDKPAFESYVRYLLLWGSEVSVQIDDPQPTSIPGLDQVIVRGTVDKVAQIETFYLSKDGHSAVHGSLLDLQEDPFEAFRTKLSTDHQPSFGPTNAPVLVVIFSDFACPFCKMESSVLRSDLPRNYPDQVRVVFKDFPNARMHPWATQAAVIGRCIFHQKPALFWNYHDWIFGHQTDISSTSLVDNVSDALKSEGLNKEELESCVRTPEPQAEIDRAIAEGISLGVTGTPILFVNGRKMLGSAWPTLKEAIEIELKHGKKTKADLGECGCGIRGLLDPPGFTAQH